MRNWSPQEWLTVTTGVISALGAFIVSIITALQGRSLKRQITAHQVQSAAQAQAILQQQAGADGGESGLVGH